MRVLIFGMRAALVLILLYPEANPTQIILSIPSTLVFNSGFDDGLSSDRIQAVNIAGNDPAVWITRN